MCFNGTPKSIFVITDRFAEGGMKLTPFDVDWKRQPFRREKYPTSYKDISKPDNLQEMLDLAKVLSKDIPFVRVDFYEVKGKTYFGEITFFPASGTASFAPEKWDMEMGLWLSLSPER